MLELGESDFSFVLDVLLDWDAFRFEDEFVEVDFRRFAFCLHFELEQVVADDFFFRAFVHHVVWLIRLYSARS